ncbi:Hypothetical_protein [Hexamita inflata]|uniref:Hypothetical_protein n=1 Tax=Hexamita inflata TaxID=28002 RepID=A0AA86QGH2_9EUKA|nr:Hypothetical protein HINF_LOCUS40374 [Hexamita inflata]
MNSPNRSISPLKELILSFKDRSGSPLRQTISPSRTQFSPDIVDKLKKKMPKFLPEYMIENLNSVNKFIDRLDKNKVIISQMGDPNQNQYQKYLQHIGQGVEEQKSKDQQKPIYAKCNFIGRRQVFD